MIIVPLCNHVTVILDGMVTFSEHVSWTKLEELL